nr:tyrosine-type recombinase/integrase [Mycobacterium botniense]
MPSCSQAIAAGTYLLRSTAERSTRHARRLASPTWTQLLRHTTASLAISAGANVKIVQRLLGHATAAMTSDRYGHLLSDDLAGAADALGKAIVSTAVYRPGSS